MNRNKLLSALVSNLANAILHDILEKAISIPEIAEKYSKEIKNSWQIALEYRNKINPKYTSLPQKDIEEITSQIIRKVKAELLLRISKGYKNLDVSLVEDFVEKALKEINVS